MFTRQEDLYRLLKSLGRKWSIIRLEKYQCILQAMNELSNLNPVLRKETRDSLLFNYIKPPNKPISYLICYLAVSYIFRLLSNKRVLTCSCSFMGDIWFHQFAWAACAWSQVMLSFPKLCHADRTGPVLLTSVSKCWLGCRQALKNLLYQLFSGGLLSWNRVLDGPLSLCGFLKIFMQYMNGDHFMQKRSKFCYCSVLHTCWSTTSLSESMDARRTTSAKWNEMAAK